MRLTTHKITPALQRKLCAGLLFLAFFISACARHRLTRNRLTFSVPVPREAFSPKGHCKSWSGMLNS